MTASKDPQPWRRARFWRNLFLYFWVFSLVGHIVELIAAPLGYAFGVRNALPSTIPLFSIAVPYGLGAVALRLFLYPLVQKKKINLITTFVLGALLTTAVEFVCAALLAASFGHNPFWDYSHRFLNLFGWVCLGNGLLFGLGSTVALKWIFPLTEKLLKRTRELYLNIAFWILFVGYILSQVYVRIIKG